MQDLDLVGLAKSFALLKLPKMPELKGRPVDDWHDANIEVRPPHVTVFYLPDIRF